MSSKRFRAKLEPKGASLFVEVPFDVKKEFGRARPPVKVSLKGYSYRSTIAVYGGKYYLGVRSEYREGAGVKGGDIVDVTISLDTEGRRVETPPDLANAFRKDDSARIQWEKLSYTHKKEHAQAILEAKKPETRARRVQKTLEMLAAKTSR